MFIPAIADDINRRASKHYFCKKVMFWGFSYDKSNVRFYVRLLRSQVMGREALLVLDYRR
jgi:hypothetical protein